MICELFKHKYFTNLIHPTGKKVIGAGKTLISHKDKRLNNQQAFSFC